MKKLPYEQIWFSLEEYLSDNTFGKPYLSTVPSKWKKEFSTVTEMYNTIMLDIQHHVNLFFNELFSHVDIYVLPINKLKLIKAACYSTFVSKLYGMLITDKNIKQTFSNNSGYSIEENQTRETNHYQDIFTPSAIKALNQTQIKQLWKAYTTWEEVFAHIKNKNFDYIYTATEIDELIEIIRIESENLFKNIASYVEDRLLKYKTELANDEKLINNISKTLIENEELVNKFEEKLETKFTKNIDEIEKNVLSNTNLIKKSFEDLKKYFDNPNNKYFIGQYMWTDGSNPGSGWKRQYNESKYRGLTLLFDYNTPSSGIVSGDIKSHSHYFSKLTNIQFQSAQRGNIGDWETESKRGLVNLGNVTSDFSENITVSGDTRTTGTEYNKAAGIYAALWKFVGVDENGKTIKEAIEVQNG